jgi:AbrB family looped-hinge helix DNA binding protein
MTVTLSSRGQLVIPAAIRKRHQLKPKARFEVLDTGRSILLVPLPTGDPFLASRGLLKDKLSTRDLLQMRREERRLEAANDQRRYGLPRA